MAGMNEKDYYKVLEVSSDASSEEIRRAFQKKARKLHPDVNKAPDAEEKFKEISEAYAVLSDPDKKRRYDAVRSGNPFAGAAAGNPYNPYGSSNNTYTGGWPFGGGFGSPFTSTQTRTSHAYNPKAGADVVFTVDLDTETAKTGCTRAVTYNRYEPCHTCHGSGSVETVEAETCPFCNGTGRMSVNLEDLFGFGVVSMVCPECEGTGKVVKDPCVDCGGSGRVLTATEVEVVIPPNCHDGQTVRIENMGNAGTNKSSTGDFVCKIGVPTERLDPRQAAGFSILGWLTPFLVFGSLSNVLGATIFFFIIPIVMSLFMIFSSSFDGKNTVWWRNALRHYIGGVQRGLIIALFTFGFVACTGGMGTAGYTGSGIHI